MMSAGETIRRIRNHLLLSQEDFAELLGVSKSSVCNYEKGRRLPRFATMRKIKAIAEKSNLDVRIEDLFDKSDLLPDRDED